jgi:two-component system, sensor histidine kinase and response regulator
MCAALKVMPRRSLRMSPAEPAVVNVLLVDDLEENLVALRALLARPGVCLLEARSGLDALELLLVNEVALALVDVQMPEMDGFELAELMRGKEQTKNVPIIFITAGSREARNVFRGYDAGAVDFLFKPIDPFILRQKVDVFMQLYMQKRELERLSQHLSRELRLSETFVAAVSHDLRNPLNSIVMAAELLIAQPDAERARRMGERIRSSSRRMTAMIEDLLDLARARLTGGIPIEPERVDLEPHARKVVAEQQSLASGRTIDISSNGDATGDFDGHRIEQVISNLLGNALRHGSKDTPVRLRLDGTKPDLVTFTVQNRGSIDAALLPHLFDPFCGGEEGHERSNGLGLGLYIVNQIVRRHGGIVNVRSNEEEGVVFVVELPREGAVAG